jgi:hypothetical protein
MCSSGSLLQEVLKKHDLGTFGWEASMNRTERKPGVGLLVGEKRILPA